MLRVALVGLGDAGKHHALALSTLAAEGLLAWTAVCARDATRAAAFRSEHDVAAEVQTFASLEALLEARACDAVILATPDGIHADQVVSAARAGVHVLVEKPLALSMAEGSRAIAAARAAGVHLAVGYHLRHHAAHRLANARLAELVGPLRTIFIRWAWPDPATGGWRARGEAKFWALAALGTHAIDLSLVFASASASASALAALTEPAQGVDRLAEISFQHAGVMAHVSVSVVHRAISRVILSGDLGELEMLGTLGARGDGEIWHRAPRQAPVAVAFTAENPYAAQLRHFVARAAGGFLEDPSLLANLDLLDRIDRQRQGTS